MIVALGIECIDSERFERAVLRRGDRLLERLFSEEERRASGTGRRRHERLAARFAAKVAARKALFGAPFSGATGWRDFEIDRRAEGSPILRFHGAARRRAEDLGIVRVHLSLSHDAPACVGHVLLEGADG